jgi:serine/threonine protein kinase
MEAEEEKKAAFSYLSRDRANLLLGELERIQAELKKTFGSCINAREATAAAVEVLKTIENILREVCLANGMADGSGGVVVQKVKRGVTTTKKLHGMGAYLIECKAIKEHLSPQLHGRLHKIRESRNQFSHESGLFCSASKGLEFCLLGFEVLKAVSPPTATLETKILQKCTVYPFDLITLGRVLGRGGFGEVREATLQGQAVAAKILHPSTFQDDPEARNKLLKEIRPLSELQHVNIVRLFGVCLDPRLDCILMEHMHRGSLRQVLNENRLPTSQVFAILREVVAGMVCAHAHTPHPILHRDLKASNILLDQYLRAAIADFGISTGAGTATKTATMAGTMAYDAPEVLDDENWTTAGDVYSFAVLVFEAVTGEVPWKGSNLKQIYRAVVLKEQRPHRKQWDDPMGEEEQRHPFLAAIVKDCWAQEPGDRPSFADLSARFDEAATLPEFQPTVERPAPKGSVFVSWRMSECKAEVKVLRTALEAKGVKVIVIGELPGGDLLQAVTQGMAAADLFIVMGTETYGRQTSGIIDTYKEMQYIVSSKKPYFLVNMNPDASLMHFQEGAANLIFNLSTVSWERWEVGSPMSPKVIDKIMQKLEEDRVAAAPAAPVLAAAPPPVPVESVEQTARKEAEEARDNAEAEAQRAKQEIVMMQQQLEGMELQREKEAKAAEEQERRAKEAQARKEKAGKEKAERLRKQAEEQARRENEERARKEQERQQVGEQARSEAVERSRSEAEQQRQAEEQRRREEAEKEASGTTLSLNNINPMNGGVLRACLDLTPLMSSMRDPRGRYGSSDCTQLLQVVHDGRTTNCTDDRVSSWVRLDLPAGHVLLLSDYALRHGGDDGMYCLMNWQLQGSNDGEQWEVLKAHINDHSLMMDKAFSVAHWSVDGVIKPFRCFRVLQTGMNSWDGPEGFGEPFKLYCAGINLFGKLLHGAGAAAAAVAADEEFARLLFEEEQLFSAPIPKEATGAEVQQINQDIISAIHGVLGLRVGVDVDLDGHQHQSLVRFDDMCTEYIQCRAYETETKAKEFYDYLNDTFGPEFTKTVLPLLVRFLAEREKRKCLWKLYENHGGFGAPRQAQIDAWRRQAKARKEKAEWHCIACGRRGLTGEACSMCSTARGKSHELKMKQEKARRAKAEQLGQEIQEWACSQCTFDNENSSSTCGICGGPKPETSIPSDKGGGTSEWSCSACTYMNSSSFAQCSMCDAPQERAEAARKEEADAQQQQQQQQEGRVVFRRVRGAIGDVGAAVDYTVAGTVGADDDYIAAERFTVKRPGYVFTHGSLGLGYYRGAQQQHLPLRAFLFDPKHPMRGVIFALHAAMTADMSSKFEYGDGNSDPALLLVWDGKMMNYTMNEAGSWVEVRLPPCRSLVLTHYALRHGCSDGDARLLHWELQGSSGGEWDVLRKHENDHSLPRKGFSVAHWPVDTSKAYSRFRVVQTGIHSGVRGVSDPTHHQLLCAGIELFGQLQFHSEWCFDQPTDKCLPSNLRKCLSGCVDPSLGLHHKKCPNYTSATTEEADAQQQQQQEGRVVFRRVRGAIGDVGAAVDYTVAFKKFSTVAAPTAKASVGSKIFYEFEMLKIGPKSCPQAGFASDCFDLTIEGHSGSGVGDDEYRCIHRPLTKYTTLSPFDVPTFMQLGHRRSSCSTMAWW